MTGRALAAPRPAEAQSGPARTAIAAVRPLDAQFGDFAPRCVPAALAPLLFPGPPRATYAIIDAAKVPNLPEMLETSGLDHRCLFTGEALDRLGAAAPWLVCLSPDSAFTRNLFSRSDAPWHLWDAAPGIFIVSRGGFDEVWSHVRKFTRVQDEAGRWFYFRFWDPAIWDGLLAGDAAFAARLLGPHQVVFRSRVTADGARFEAAGAAS